MRKTVGKQPRVMRSVACTPVCSRCAGFQAGFTLFETLVVLLLVGVVSGLIFEAAAQVMGMETRLERQLTRLRGEALRADWMRQVVQGLQPDYPNGKHIFEGSARRFSGLTTNALSASYGGLQPFSVMLTRDPARGSMRLDYDSERGGTASVLLSWSGNQGVLRYLDDRGAAHEHWPPPLGKWPQLPRAIAVEGQSDGTPWLIVAAQFGPTWTYPRLRDAFGVSP